MQRAFPWLDRAQRWLAERRASARQRILRRLEPYQGTWLGKVALAWRRIHGQTDFQARSAAVSFFLLLSAAPLLISAMAFTAVFGRFLDLTPVALVEGLIGSLQSGAPIDLSGAGIERELLDLVDAAEGLGLGSFVVTLIAGSRVISVLQGTLTDAAHDGGGRRSLLKTRAAATLTLPVVLLTYAAVRLVVRFLVAAGEMVGEVFFERGELLVNWLLPFGDVVVILVTFGVVAQLGSRTRHRLRALSIGGGVFWVGMWLMSGLYAFYVDRIAHLDVVYGWVARLAALLVWLYLGSMCAVASLQLILAVSVVDRDDGAHRDRPSQPSPQS